MPSERIFPVVGARGDRLLEFASVEESQLGSIFPALMIAKHACGFLVVYNAWRKCWELPGGLVEPDETPLAAAIREFAEESGQTPENVRLVGRIQINEPAKERIIAGAVFACDLIELAPFTPNEEIDAVAVWPGEGLELDAIDLALLSFYR